MELAPRLLQFIDTMTRAVDEGGGEARILPVAREAMKRLVKRDHWLPEEYSEPHPQYYQQYLLYRDPRERFSVVSFVWGPGQKTPVHDHTVWGVIGMYKGAETCTAWHREEGRFVKGETLQLEPGQVESVSPTIGDIHEVANAFTDRVSISIHAYGADIGTVKRHVFNVQTGSEREFVSGYANGR